MALTLNTHALLGQMSFAQVDYNWNQIQVQFNDLETTALLQIPPNNLTADRDPLPSDDFDAGFRELSRWFNTVNETLWVCIDPTVGDAVWIDSEFDVAGFGSAALADLGTEPTDVPQNSDLGTMAYESAANYPPASRTLTAGAGITGGGDLSANRTIAIDIASDAELFSGTSEKIPDSEGLYSAAAPVVSSGAGSWTPDMDAGRVFARTLTGASVMENPTNQRAGQSGLIYVIQDAVGGRALTLGSHWKLLNTVPAINQSADAVNLFSYYVRESGAITLSYLGSEI